MTSEELDRWIEQELALEEVKRTAETDPNLILTSLGKTVAYLKVQIRIRGLSE